MSDDLEEKVRQHLDAEHAKTPLEQARDFIHAYVLDSEPDDLLRSVQRMCQVNPYKLVVGLRGLEHILSHPQEPRTLLELVEHDANVSLDDSTDEGARAWLTELTRNVRRWMGDAAPTPASD